ncbi:MAG: nucleotide sugar dehydrogenase, partial [Verrucomicrobia bacterium]
IYVCKDLLEEKAQLAIYDPKVSQQQIFADLGQEQTLPDGRVNTAVTVVDDPYEAAKDAHAVAILTEWDEFRDLDYKRIYDNMPKPAFLFDGRNITDLAKLREIGFVAKGIGKP